MIAIKISNLLFEDLLYRAGYTRHPKGYGHGWIYPISPRKRFHAFYEGGHVIIHLDITINGRHNVGKLTKNFQTEYVERERLYDLFPEARPRKKEYKKKGIIAPNVRELQKQQGVILHKAPRTIWEKVMHFLFSNTH